MFVSQSHRNSWTDLKKIGTEIDFSVERLIEEKDQEARAISKKEAEASIT